MTVQEWLDKAKENKEALLQLIQAYHPLSFPVRRKLPITAQMAEDLCEKIRGEIITEAPLRESPTVEFNRALTAGDWGMIDRLLNEAWFGVPESTECWQVPGFKQAVDLLEELPDQEGI